MQNINQQRFEQKVLLLRKKIATMENALVAFSGGIDSTFLLQFVADILGPAKVKAAIVKSIIQPPGELEEARRLARRIGVKMLEIQGHELDDKEFCLNTPSRCYICKNKIYTEMLNVAEEEKVRNIIDGTNSEDTGDYRPGIKAAAELGIVSPLMDAGLTKAEIRSLAKNRGLPNWDKPSSPCLCSRIPYYETITSEKLHQVAQAENYIKSMGIKDVRVRHHGQMARIEVPPEAIINLTAGHMRQTISSYFHKIGFKYVSIDLDGFRSGSLNEILDNNVLTGEKRLE